MALTSVLVDRARYTVIQQTPIKVEGRTQTGSATSAWFKARLTYESDDESADPQGAQRVVDNATLLFGVRDTEGVSLIDRENGRCAVKASDRVEVNSREIGRATWELTDDPKPIRKRRRVIGFRVTMVRIDREGFAEPRLP